MQQQQDRVPSNRDKTCPLCKKTFTQEPSRKRHYYYCRSKRLDTNSSRRRSCVACAQAKTRCIIPDDAMSEACIRCRARGVECEFALAARQKEESRESGVALAANTAHSTDQRSRPDGVITPLLLAKSSTQSNNLINNSISKISSDSAASIGWPMEFHISDASLKQLDMFGLNPLFDNQSINSLHYPFNEEPELLENVTSKFTPWHFSNSSLFQQRAFLRPNDAPMVSLALQILRSYPFMILQRATLPPFISPLQFSWAEIGVGPSQNSLVACIGLVQLFKSRTNSNRNFVWNLIKLEQRKILSKHKEFDKWELLAAFQALLVYCLLRLQEVPAGSHSFDAALVSTVNHVFNALVLSAGGIRKMTLPDEPNATWMDWVYNESRRRTVLIFQVVNILIEMTTEASSYTTCGFVLLPLANNVTLWHANGIEEWKLQFERYNKERKMHGLSQTGVLTKLQLGDDCVVLSPVEWEEWRAEVGEIGTIVMIVGALL